MFYVCCRRTWAVVKPDNTIVSAQDSIAIQNTTMPSAAPCETFGPSWEKNQEQEEQEVCKTGLCSAGATLWDM